MSNIFNNVEMMRRLRTAGKYQRKAVRALLPDQMSSHLDVIEDEIKGMFKDIALEMVMEYKKCENESCKDEADNSKTSGKTKKVDIQ